ARFVCDEGRENYSERAGDGGAGEDSGPECNGSYRSGLLKGSSRAPVEGSRRVTLKLSWRNPSTNARDDGGKASGFFDNLRIAASLLARFGGYRLPLQEKI